jgi:hypothetical protein
VNITGILDAVVSHAMATGLFERVNQHEPKNAPGNGMRVAVWADTIEPYSGGSGLNSTSALISLNVRIYQNMVMEPQDMIDPMMMSAVDTLLTAYSGDFELGGVVREVDLLGETGTPLSARAGYVPIDNKMFRVMTIVLPVIVNDAWAQSP